MGSDFSTFTFRAFWGFAGKHSAAALLKDLNFLCLKKNSFKK